MISRVFSRLHSYEGVKLNPFKVVPEDSWFSQPFGRLGTKFILKAWILVAGTRIRSREEFSTTRENLLSVPTSSNKRFTPGVTVRKTDTVL